MMQTKFIEALTFACQMHADHMRKGTNTPYFSHLMAVCSLVLEHGGDDEQAIAALLHDSIEDQSEKFGGADKLKEEIKQKFGERVLAIVEGCTDAETIPKPPWRQRKEAYLEHLAHSPEEVLLVSASDKLHNARCISDDYRAIGEELWQRFQGGREGSIWYYKQLVTIFKSRNVHNRLVTELERVVQTIEMLAEYAEILEECGPEDTEKRVAHNKYNNYFLVETAFDDKEKIDHWNFGVIQGCNVADIHQQLIRWLELIR